jgi:hypothetical protein
LPGQTGKSLIPFSGSPAVFLSTGFPKRDVLAEGNLFAIDGKFRLVAGRDFYFLRRKFSYHFQRLGNWNCLIKQRKKENYATDTHTGIVCEGVERQICARCLQREQHGTHPGHR